MAGLSRGISKLTDYPGHVMLCKIRMEYGLQTHLERMGILHNWYSDLLAYLPILFEGKPELEEFKYLLNGIHDELMSVWQAYSPAFEGVKECGDSEKTFILGTWGVKERLDKLTAMSKIIEGRKVDTEEMEAG
jgi:hypothetical protein